jgi:hypothetical protein
MNKINEKKENKEIAATETKLNVAVGLSVTSKQEVKAIESFISGLTDYETELTVSETLNAINLATSDLTQIALHLTKIDELITIYLDDDIAKAKLVELQTALKDCKNLIKKFKQDSTEIENRISFANQKDKVAYLRTQGFYGWKTPIERWSNKVYLLKGFSENCKVYLLPSGSKSIVIKIVIKPLTFGTSKKQDAHFQQLCDENFKTVEGAIQLWLGKVSTSGELDSIISVQATIEQQEWKEKMQLKADKILPDLI